MMIKNYYYAIAFFSSCMAFSQSGNVGINTENPVATLHVEGSPTTTTKVDGIIAPRLTGDELKAKDAVYTAAQTGTLVYVTAAVGTSTAKTGNVTAPGYYYFDGSIWQLVPNGNIEPWYNVATTKAATANNQDIYQMGKVGIGTATPDRTLSVVQPGSGSPFIDSSSPDFMRFESTANSSAIGHYFKAKNSSGASKEMVMGINPNARGNGLFGLMDQFGDDYLSMDLVSRDIYANVPGGRFGIGLYGPTAKLSVKSNGNTNATKALNIANSSNTNLVTVLDNGNVGIGTATPTERLHVNNGNALIGGSSNPMLRIHSDQNTSGQGGQIEFNEYNTDWGSRLRHSTQFDSTNAQGIYIESKTNGVYTPIAVFDQDNNRVGIGTTQPTELLDVAGKTKTTTFQMTNGAANDAVLVSDANGNGTWKSLQDVSVKKTVGTPPVGTTANYGIPCASTFDIIQLTNSNTNFASTIYLPDPSCAFPGQKVRIISSADTLSTISKNNTTYAYGTTQLLKGDVYEYTFINSRWELTAFPTRGYGFCNAPNNSSTTLVNPTSPRTIVEFYNACWAGTVTLPSGGSVGDILIIDDTANINVIITTTNTTMTSDFTLTIGGYTQFIKTNLGWTRQF